MHLKSSHSQSFHNFLIFQVPVDKILFDNFLFLRYLVLLTLSCQVEQKVIHTQGNLYLEVSGLFKDVWPFVTNGHKAVKIIKHI